MAEPGALSFEDVVAASGRIAGHAHRTPVLRSRAADQRVGAEVFFKCENFQRVGAFRFRGAFNALSQFDAAQRRAGVVYDHPHVIAGQGTAALELFDEVGPLDGYARAPASASSSAEATWT